MDKRRRSDPNEEQTMLRDGGGGDSDATGTNRW